MMAYMHLFSLETLLHCTYAVAQVEALKHGFAVRTALGDPGSKAQPYATAHRITAAVSDLLNDTFIDQLRAATHDDTVLEDTAYGGKWNPKGESPPEEHGTSHFGVVDAQRNAVSMTTSVISIMCCCCAEQCVIQVAAF